MLMTRLRFMVSSFGSLHGPETPRFPPVRASWAAQGGLDLIRGHSELIGRRHDQRIPRLRLRFVAERRELRTDGPDLPAAFVGYSAPTWARKAPTSKYIRARTIASFSSSNTRQKGTRIAFPVAGTPANSPMC